MVFWPPALVLVIAVIAGLIDFNWFLALTTAANNFVLAHLDWLFSGASFGAVIVVAMVALSPLGRVRIGGPDAKPILSRWNWFSITLCTTVAIGILFWGAAEPIFHLRSPPGFSGALPNSPEAARFALSSMFLHWTITPFSIYAVPSLAFALAYYNYNKPYSLSAPVSLLVGKSAHGLAGDTLDALALYALVAGVAAALGAGVMTVAGGLDAILGIKDSIAMRLMVTTLIVGAFIISSISGLQRGIKWLSDVNARLFIVIALFIFIAGPTMAIVAQGAESFSHYLRTLIPANLALGARSADPWTHAWTVFFFANWLAWAPITALFLGRISVGYTVREFLLFNLVLPALFSVFWMSIFGGTAISFELSTNGALSAALDRDGPEAVIYALLELLPWFGFAGIVFLITVFISFVTAMDSNTLSITGICLKSPQDNTHPEHNPHFARHTIMVKIFWGVLIGVLSFIMTATTGIDGVRMLSNLGGVAGLLVLILSGLALIRLMAMSFHRNEKPGNTP